MKDRSSLAIKGRVSGDWRFDENGFKRVFAAKVGDFFWISGFQKQIPTIAMFALIRTFVTINYKIEQMSSGMGFSRHESEHGRIVAVVLCEKLVECQTTWRVQRDRKLFDSSVTNIWISCTCNKPTTARNTLKRNTEWTPTLVANTANSMVWYDRSWFNVIGAL